MKKLATTAIGLGALLFGLTAQAVILTDIDNPYKWLEEGESHTVVHDLTSQGVPGTYSVYWASLVLGFSDGYTSQDSAYDLAEISGEGLSGVIEVDGTHIGGFDIHWIGIGAAGLEALNMSGMLAVTVTAINTPKWKGKNDFWWKTSKLVAKAEEETQVPEPGSLALIGMGLVGVGMMRRRNARQ